MKIKITAELPVPKEVRPTIGDTFEVVGRQEGERPMFFINTNSERDTQRIGVTPEECEIVEE